MKKRAKSTEASETPANKTSKRTSAPGSNAKKVKRRPTKASVGASQSDVSRKTPTKKSPLSPRGEKKRKAQHRPGRGLPGSNRRPSGPGEQWSRIAVARAPAFEHSVPAYLLDGNYFFLDWNAAFDELIAGPLKLKRRYSHAQDFVVALEDWKSVWKRSLDKFESGNEPLIDMESLALRTERYGLIKFQKIAVQIADEQARLAAWSVYLNILGADHLDDVWDAIARRLESDLNWSRYAISYDGLLLSFDDYCDLTDLIVGRMADCRRCLDLGTGTGNAALKLLRAREDREVWAVESNHTMIQQLIEKVQRASDEDDTDYFARLMPLKQDVLRLDDVRDLLPEDYFDGAILVNVLYAVDDPDKCLRQVFDLLRPGGRMVLSTPDRSTSVDKLFGRMREVLERKGLFHALRQHFLDARQRHRDMDQKIHRDTESDIRGYVEESGFKIVDWRREYVDAVAVVEAEKP